jgi:hypothetical protein
MLNRILFLIRFISFAKVNKYVYMWRFLNTLAIK